jgi:hypothetical protein
MKYYEAQLGDIVLVNGKLGRVICYGDGKTVTITKLEGKDRCPHCNKEIESYFDALESSPLFQESVKFVAHRK